MDSQRREVRRERLMEADPSEVWEALVDPRLLEEWLADNVELEPTPGAPASFRIGDEEREGTVLRVEEERTFSFTWSRPGELPSEVELTVDAVAGGTRVVVVERGLAGPTAFAATGWGVRLDTLAAAVGLVAV
jgi:uncharacterized protein YndB with AHSA1/START domain